MLIYYVQHSNIFDDMMAPSVSEPDQTAHSHSEAERYLSQPTEYTADPLGWWHERRATYPRLSRMALNFLTIPGEFYI